MGIIDDQCTQKSCKKIRAGQWQLYIERQEKHAAAAGSKKFVLFRNQTVKIYVNWDKRSEEGKGSGGIVKISK